ncbi:MAG: hypothetical protein HY076_05320 [Candidatus Eisenbacteria bacterium]|uniref:Uncharacterized protein n=1 Tax=Eiseniibacteriota bacterium TaxID=2212470 RepID=A0A9D6LAL5_UNCEI|nr:hypothetical protein [Candidatus Eisenbacteria bacterium]MBI3539673.1 hypothetical protein [Candidatus Eisenbacteria bacterium]
MSRLRRLAVLLVPVAVGLVSAALPGRAQVAGSARYAFADTTLLRDTLGLHFDRLFPLADSLQVLPDTLRALSIRYLWSLNRIVHLADSLGVPVDSVGPVIVRERFNPLAAGAGQRRDFTYNSVWTVGQTQSTWRNGADYGFSTGPVFVRNSTTIEMDRYTAGNKTSLRQTRSTTTELGYKLSPDFSLGGRVNVDRFDSRDPGAVANVGETKNEYQLSLRSKQKPVTGLTSEFNVFSGLLDLHNASLEKRGVSGNMSSRVRHAAGTWLTQEVNATLDGNLSRTRIPTSPGDLNTRDHSENVRGTVSLFQSAPIGFKGNATYRHVQVESPADSVNIRRILTDQTGADGTVRLRIDTDRYVDLATRTGETKQATAVGATDRNTRRDDGFSAVGRYELLGFALDGSFQNNFTNSAFPTRSASGGYGELQHQRSLDGAVTRILSKTISARLSAAIGLTSYRYYLIGRYPTPPVSRDLWRQSWRVSANYASGANVSSNVAFEVSKNELINIPAASTGANSNVRSYRGEWTWSYRLLPGLTATQRNSIDADYNEFPFSTDNNRLTLDYGAVTELNAVVTPRLNIQVSHNSKQTPGGNYTLYPDGNYYFSRADDNVNYNLHAIVSYSPSPTISLSVSPSYFTASRAGTVNGAAVTQRSSKTLDFSGGANINVKVGAKGSVRGDIRRTYRADRSITYTSGIPDPSPRSELDYWNGSLQFSWTLGS